MVISKFQNSFSALQAILRYPNSFLGTINDSGILHCTKTIKIMNYSVIKCQKNGAKMNKIVQKWQFQKTFYTTMETVLGFSQNRLAELFQNYVFSTNQYLYFDLYVAECQIQFFWPASRFGVYVCCMSMYWRLRQIFIKVSLHRNLRFSMLNEMVKIGKIFRM